MESFILELARSQLKMCLATEDSLSLRRGSDSVRDVDAMGSKGVTCEAD